MPLEFDVFRDEIKKKNNNKNIPEELHYPFRLCIVGSTGSGKTNIIKNLLFKHYKDILEKVFYFSAKTDTLNQIKQRHQKEQALFDLELFRQFDNETLEQMDDQLDEQGENTLFVFDDMLSKNVMSKHKNNAIDQIIQNGREAGMSIILTAQRYMDLNSNARKDNCSMLIILDNLGLEEVRNLVLEQKINVDKEQFKKLLDKHAGNQYDFLVIDFTQPINERFRDSNFNVIDLESDRHELIEGNKPKKK